MVAGKRRVIASRVGRTMTLSPRTEAILEGLTRTTGVSRGRIVDLAIANVTACETCEGRGTLDGPMGLDTDPCHACRGARIVPGTPA